MIKKQILSMIMALIIVVLISNNSFANVQTQQQIDEENGRAVGVIWGEIAAQKDYINNRPSDWQKAHDTEKARVTVQYNLTQENYLTRNSFLTGFRKGFEEGYINSYKSLGNKANATPYDIGILHGEFFGNLLGYQEGIKEYHEGKTNDWRRSVPADASLISTYSLNRDTKNYSDGFMIGFKRGYQEAYTEGFRYANVENHRLTKENGLIHGEAVGRKQGEVLGRIDFVDGKNNDWKKALPIDSEIILHANLLRENIQYREGFIAGYKEGFKAGYIETFQNSNLSTTLDNIKVTEVSMLGGNITSPDSMLSLEIKPGSFYWDTFFSIEKDISPIYYHNTKRLEGVTSKYTLEVANHLGYIVLKEPLTLSFKYYGSEKGGIYQLINGEWRYLYSHVEGERISTVIPTGNFSGGTYAVLIDEKYPELRDIYTHWANQEIYTFVRRFYVAGYSDLTFRPTENVSRGEFVSLLSRVLKWSRNNKGTDFKDVDDFGVYHDDIMTAVALGYIKGYPDQTFKPNNNITYQEIEWIMQRIPWNQEFRWRMMEERMLYEKFTRSESRLNMKNKITRGEIIYMLHELQRDGKIR